MPFIGLLWFLLTLVPLVFLQRLLHREIQAVFLILTRSVSLSQGLFSLIFLPGVFLHEASHYLMAKLLLVRTGKFSLIPSTLPNGRLRLGYVETAQTDIFRDSLIGLAPLIAGSLFVAFAGIGVMNLDVLFRVFADGNFALFFQGLSLIPKIKDVYVWLYFIFAVSSTMMPSESDRHAWLPLGLWAGILLALAVFVGAGAWMTTYLAPVLDGLLNSAALLFLLSGVVQLALLIPVWLIHRLVARISGVDVR